MAAPICKLANRLQADAGKEEKIRRHCPIEIDN